MAFLLTLAVPALLAGLRYCSKKDLQTYSLPAMCLKLKHAPLYLFDFDVIFKETHLLPHFLDHRRSVNVSAPARDTCCNANK